MSYNPNIPQTTDNTLQSYGQLRSNFQAIDAAFADNHIGLTRDPEFSGMHSVLTMRPTTDPTTGVDQVALYNKLVGGIPELFFRPNNSQTPIQLTYPSIQTGLQSVNPDVYYARQYTFSAGPFIIYGGIILNPSDGDSITLSPGTTLISVDLVAVNPSTVVVPAYAVPTNILGTSFTIRFSGSFVPPHKTDLFYFAVGL